MPAPRILCIVWAPHSARMDELSEALHAKKEYLSLFYGPKYFAPLRYLALFFRTGILLLRERPDVVYAQNPSTLCPLSCVPYCKLFRKKLVIDHHAVWSMKTFANTSFERPIRLLERLALDFAYANTAPHELWANELEKLGGKRVLAISDYVEKSDFSRNEDVRQRFLKNGQQFLLLAPHGGHPLERIESETAAASTDPSIALIISGPESKLKKRIESLKLSSNVRYVGFLPKKEYRELEASTDIGLCISDEPYTISHSLLEFAANSVPSISTRQEAVIGLFGDSLLYVHSSDTKDIETAIHSLTKNARLYKEYQRRISEAQKQMGSKRKEALAELSHLMEMS